MPWVSKERPTAFEEEPIEGLYFLLGDVLAQAYRQDWLRGKKYPTIVYPSGVTREVEKAPETGRDGSVHLYGHLHLPLEIERGYLVVTAAKIAGEVGFNVKITDENRFSVWRPDMGGQYRVTCGDGGKRITNIEYKDREPNSRRAPRPMELLDDVSRAVLPELYANESLKGRDVFAPVKFFTPDSSWTWYATEFDGDDTFFGLVSGFDVELGYFSLSELKSVRGPLGLAIERDLYYTPENLDKLRRSY